MNGLYLVVLCMFGVAAATLTDEQAYEQKYNDVLAKDRAMCKIISGVSDSVHGLATGYGILTNDDGLKRYMVCMLNTGKAISIDGAMDMSTMFQRMPPTRRQLLSAVEQNCSHLSESTPKESAWIVYNCFKDNLGPYYVFV